MAFVVAVALVVMDEEHIIENIQRKQLRDKSNPLDLPEDM